MENHQIMSISIMEILIFLKASEFESFSKAASCLDITTSMVSKRIAALEKAIDTPLFNRVHSRVELTAAGRSLAQDWSGVYHSLLFSLEKAARKNDVKSRPIIFGLGSCTNSDRYLTPLLSGYEAETPGSEFRVELRPNFDLMEDLLKGNFDVVFMPLFMSNKIAEYFELDTFVGLRFPLLVGMSMENPLSHKTTVTVEDLKNCEFIYGKNASGEEHVKLLEKLCMAKGFSPTYGTHIEYSDSAYLNTIGNQVFVTDRLYWQMKTNATVFRELEGTESGLLVVWRKDAASAVIDFIGYAKEFFKDCTID